MSCFFFVKLIYVPHMFPAKIYDVLKSTRHVEDEVRLHVYTAVDNVDKVKRNLEELCKKEATEG